MMRPSLLSSLSTLATKMGVGGKKQSLLPTMPPPPPTGGGTPDIEEFCRRRPGCNVYVDSAARHGSTNAQGQRQGRSLVNYDDDDNSGNGNDNDWGHCQDAQWADGVGDKFEAPLERDEAEFGPSGVLASPPLGSGLAGGRGSQNADNGAG
jgi:hypothetical protein